MKNAIKRLWYKFTAYALENVTDGLGQEQRFKFLLGAVYPNSFGKLNLYAHSDTNVVSFSKNIVKTSQLLEQIVYFFNRVEPVVQVFDKFNTTIVPVHMFFVDDDNYLIDTVEYVEDILKKLVQLCEIIETPDRQDDDFLTRKNKAIVKSNLDNFLGLAESLYAVQQNIILKTETTAKR